MVQECVYKPHYDCYINKVSRQGAYAMSSFHLHKKYEIYYQLEGQRNYFIADSTYLIQPGNLVLVDQDEPHKTASPSDAPYSRIVLNFNKQYVASIAEQMEGLDLFDVFQSKIRVLVLSEEQQKHIEHLLNRLLHEQDFNDAAANTMSRLIICELLLEAHRFAKEQEPVAAQSDETSNQTIKDIMRHIALHYNEPLSLQTLAQRFAFSPYYLSRLFKRTVNISLIEYINSIRMHEAKTLLEETNARIESIATEVGFGTTTHFTRIFKETIGMSPQSYRRMYRDQL